MDAALSLLTTQLLHHTGALNHKRYEQVLQIAKRKRLCIPTKHGLEINQQIRRSLHALKRAHDAVHIAIDNGSYRIFAH
ncbi:hypothetical protein D3C85_1619100 [compost metagenome]